jgi:hypothetical protein
MTHEFASKWINEAMLVHCTATTEFPSKKSKAMEAKAGPTIAAEHFVAFGYLSVLVIQIILCHSHLA